MQNLDQEIERLADELSRMNQAFEMQMKAYGIDVTALQQAKDDIKSGNIPQEVKDAFEASVAEAKHAGSARATQNTISTSTASTSHKQARRGAIRL